MATIISASSGNFSAGSTWVGGIVPTVGDIARATTGHTVTIDVDVTVDGVENASTTGKFVLGNGRTLTANVTGAASGGFVEVTATTSATIIGNITATGATSSFAVRLTGVGGTLNVTGNVTGGSGSSQIGIGGAQPCTVNVTGNVSAGAGSTAIGVDLTSASAVLTVNGTVTANIATPAIRMDGTSPSCTVVGNVFAANTTNGTAYGIQMLGASAQLSITGNITGGGVNGAEGVIISGATSTLTVIGNVYPNSDNGILMSGLGIITGDIFGGVSSNRNGVLLSGATARLTVNGDVYGGTVTSSTNYGIYGGGLTTVVTVNGNAYGVNAPAFGGGVFYLNGDAVASTTSPAIINVAQSFPTTLIHDGNLVDASNGTQAIAVQRYLHEGPTTPYTHTIYAYDGLDLSNNILVGDEITLVTADSDDILDPADVREGTIYAAGAATGTLAVPPAASVAVGVPVDATVGTGAVLLSDIAATIGAQIAAATTSP